jgi:hypothetical protein
MRKILYLAASFGLALTTFPAVASPPQGVSMTLSNPNSSKTLVLPAAADNSPVISLGSAIDPQTGEVVEGYAIIHHKKNQAKPTERGGPKNTVCYSFLAADAKWKLIEPWVINASNNFGTNTTTIFSNFSANVNKWEDAADGVVGNGQGVDIFGNGSYTSFPLVADSSAPDGANEIYFGSISSAGTIGVTTVWGVFSGPASGRKLVEWDMVFDQEDFDWSLTGEATKMDFNNIATHELGHSAGLADLYQTGCSEQTMYGYATEGETNKPTLDSGDVLGISTLY